MNEPDKRLSKPKGHRIVLEEMASGSLRPDVPCRFMLSLIICLLCLFSLGQSQVPPSVSYCSGQQYSFKDAIDTQYCDNFYYLWTAPAGSSINEKKCTFTWIAPDVTSPTLINISLLVSNKYLLSCNSRDEIEITVYPLPAVSLTPDEVEVCKGQSAVLTANTARAFCPGLLTYRWYRDGDLIEGAESSIYNADTSGIYRVEVTCSGTGCSSSSSARVIVKNCGPLTITCPDDIEICNDSGENFATIIDLGTPKTSDPQATVTNNAPASNQYPIGKTTVTWTAKDDAGNEASCDQVIFVENCNRLVLELKKITLNTTVKRGEEIHYVITLCSPEGITFSNIALWDVLPPGVELVSVYPEYTSSASLSSTITWDIGTLKSGECKEFYVVIRIPIVDVNYDMEHSVQGEGFVNVHNDYNTHQGPESVINCAYAKADLVETISSCASSRVVDPGTELKRREFGSGTYESEELTRMRTENKSIKSVSSLSAVRQPTTFDLPGGGSIAYGTKWTEKSKGINTITGATMNEEYTFANKIDKNRSIELYENGSTMKTEVEFEGTGHIGVLKKEAPDSHPKVKPAYEGIEDYVGGFKVYEMVDEYGSSVQSNKSVTGYGYVAVDKRVKDSQRTYESGTGSYKSNEIIETLTNYIAKNINLVHGPTNYSYTSDVAVNQDMKWNEGMWSKSGLLRGGDIFKDPSNCGVPVNKAVNGSPPVSYISERYSTLDYLKKEFIASGLNEMNTNASFSGIADYSVKSMGENHTDKIVNDERYVGQYDITRKVLITGGSKYDRPHLTVTKEGNFTTKWFNRTNAQVADYVITITNDGNRPLAPIYIRDVFPPGTEYIGSSIRPSSLSKTEVNWTLTNLGVGNTIEIKLELNVTEYAPDNVVNRVMVCGMNGEYCVSAAAYSALESGSLGCYQPEVIVDKTAELDALDPTLIHYTIQVRNNANTTVAATLTDTLPARLTFLNASREPNKLNGLFLEWIVLDLKPKDVVVIEYLARATMDGSYVNTVHLDASAVDGTGYDTVDASARVDVRNAGAAPKTTRYGGWQPPNWNMTSPDEGITIELSPDEDLV
ncbi:MAG: hypothetical protein A4E49_02309 [Methanosaeta sp. PtaU1.Bin112]|nr:MAG: hypothetical protein A4E49_02309 [Methanosaeta sp. PtaU1.Bin112]